MIGELVDKAVALVSPEAAVKRAHARGVLRKVVDRNYDAAKTDRLNSNWRTQNLSADLELQEAADTIRARARSLVRNNAYAKGILHARCRNVIGCGIKPQAMVEGAEGFNTIAETAFARWAKHCDITGRLSFYEMQQLAFRETDEAGDVLIRFVESSNRRRLVPLALELIEADRLATDHFPRGVNTATGNEVRRGVEINADGEVVQYWLYSSHPRGVNTWRQEAKPYPASEFLHLYHQERIGQTRGVSLYAPIVMWLKNLGYYVENELQSSAVSSCFTAAITSLAGAADGGLVDTIDSEASDTDGNTFEYLQPGLIARLMPGEDVKTINPGRSHSEAQAWIDLMLRSMAVGTGLSYERLSRDYSKTNYSSNRASDLEDRRAFRPLQEWAISHLCEPVWCKFIEACVLANVPGFPTALDLITDYHHWTSHRWQSPGWEWVDPAKEQKASADAINANLSTLADEVGKRGKDWKEVLQQRAKEKAFAESLGVVSETAEETEQEIMDVA